MKLHAVYILAISLLVDGQTPGTVWNFTQVSSTKDTIVVGWNYTPGDLTFKRHDIVRNSDPPLPNFCPLVYCEQEFQYMETCGTYNFTITSYFVDPDDSSLEVSGDSASTVGRTADEVPGPPRNLEITEQTDAGVTVKWGEPSILPQCVDRYRVCAKLENQQDFCLETTENTYTAKLELCARYTITVSAVTPNGLVSTAEELSFYTLEGVPGPVVDLTVLAVGSNFINVTFGRPLDNPYCVQGYNYNFRPNKFTGSNMNSFERREARREECDPCYAVFSPLNPCTSYTLTVNAYNPSLVDGKVTEKTAETEEIPPMDPASIIGTPLGPDSIEVIWTGNPKDACAGDAYICWVDNIHPVETCMNYQQGALGGSLVITDLLPCSLYTITVVFKSPSGMESAPLVNFTRTFDVDPNPVQNLTITDLTANTVTYMFSYPLDQVQCVSSHEILVENLDKEDTLHQHGVMLGTDIDFTIKNDAPTITETENGLDACTNYRICVRTISPTGLVSECSDIDFATLEAQPGQPRGLAERYTDGTTITLVFYQPEENPSCATSYHIKWDSSSGEVGQKEHIPEYPLPFQMEEILQGLASCTEYTITVIAVGSTKMEEDKVSYREVEFLNLTRMTSCGDIRSRYAGKKQYLLHLPKGYLTHIIRDMCHLRLF